VNTSYQPSTYQIFAGTTPSTFGTDLAVQAIAAARAGKRVAVLAVGHFEKLTVNRAIKDRLAPGEYDQSLDLDRSAHRRASGPNLTSLASGGSIRLVDYSDELAGMTFDLIVASCSVHPKLLQEARGRLVGAHQ